MDKLNLVLLSTVLLLTACEYEPSGNNYLDLTPPEDYIPVEISLNDVDPSDTIYLCQITFISIKINSPKDLQQAVVLLDGQEYKNMWSDSLGFLFYPDEIDEGAHQLTVKANFTSGTGSLAEMMGWEGYMGELSWNIHVIHNPLDSYNVEYRINEEGFLEIFWDIGIPDSYIQSYTIHSGFTLETDITINDVKQKSFVDYGYVCEYAHYEVKTLFKDGNILWQTLSIDTPAPTVYFEDLGLDSLRVYWDKPFANGRFSLIVDNNVMVSEICDTSIIIPQYFGKTRQFLLEIKPQKAEYDNVHNNFSVFESYCQGTSLELPNWPLYAYNEIDNIIYTSNYSSLVAYDASSFEIKNTVAIDGNPWGLLYGGKLASAPHNSTVAAMTGEETWIFADSRFVNPIKINPLPGDVHTRLAALTSNDRFFVAQNGSNNCIVFNTLTGEEIFQFSYTYNTIYDFPDFITVSEDGQFFCASSENGMEIFEINGTTTNLLYTDTRQYQGAMFVPSQPDIILLRVGSNIELRKLPGFNTLQVLDVSENGAKLCNIDPVSMNLLYHQNGTLRVCKVSNLSETIFEINSDETTCKMFNNKLLTYGNGGITFDINPYLGN